MATPKYNEPGKKKNMPATTRGVGKATPMPKVTKKGLPGGTNMSRMAADDKSRQNPVFKSVSGYGKNLFKEVKDFGRTYRALDNAINAVGPGTDARANRLREQEDKDFGQLMGALLQGRRYK